MAKNTIGESREDYLEAIYILIKENGAARPTDIASFLGYSRPSVSVALKKLEDEGYVVRNDWKIELTETGQGIAQDMYGKHSFFKGWLVMAGVDEKTASEEACRIEHVISDDSFHKVVDFMKRTHGDAIKDLV